MPRGPRLTWEEKLAIFNQGVNGVSFEKIAEVLDKLDSDGTISRDSETVRLAYYELPFLTSGQAEELSPSSKEVWDKFQQHFDGVRSVLLALCEQLKTPAYLEAQPTTGC